MYIREYQITHQESFSSNTQMSKSDTMENAELVPLAFGHEESKIGEMIPKAIVCMPKNTKAQHK